MGDRPQEFERVALLLKRVMFRVSPANEFDAGRVDLGGLSLRGRRLDLALDNHARPGRQMLHDALVVRQLPRYDDLHVSLARAVVEFEEAKPALGVAPRADPT